MSLTKTDDDARRREVEREMRDALNYRHHATVTKERVVADATDAALRLIQEAERRAHGRGVTEGIASETRRVAEMAAAEKAGGGKSTTQIVGGASRMAVERVPGRGQMPERVSAPPPKTTGPSYGPLHESARQPSEPPPCGYHCAPMYEHPDICVCEGDCEKCHGDDTDAPTVAVEDGLPELTEEVGRAHDLCCAGTPEHEGDNRGWRCPTVLAIRRFAKECADRREASTLTAAVSDLRATFCEEDKQCDHCDRLDLWCVEAEARAAAAEKAAKERG